MSGSRYGSEVEKRQRGGGVAVGRERKLRSKGRACAQEDERGVEAVEGGECGDSMVVGARGQRGSDVATGDVDGWVGRQGGWAVRGGRWCRRTR